MVTRDRGAVVLCMLALAACDAEPSAAPVPVVDAAPQVLEPAEPPTPPEPPRPEIVPFTLPSGVVLDRWGADVYGVRLRPRSLASFDGPTGLSHAVRAVFDRIPFLSSSAVLQRIVLTEYLRSEGRSPPSVSDPESGTILLGSFMDVMCAEIVCGEFSVMLRTKFPDHVHRAAWPSQWDTTRTSASAERYVGAVGGDGTDRALRRRGFLSREASQSFEADFDSVVAGILAEPELFARACAESPTIERKRVLALEFLTECGYGR